MMVRRDVSGVRLLTRNGKDWTGRFLTIVQAAAGLKARSCLIDGEAVCCDENGLAVFALLRYRERPAEIFLYAFDLLELDGQDLRREPLETRNATLASLLAGAGQGCGLSSTSSTAATSSTATPAGLAARASCRSAWARRMSAAARGTGSSSRTRQRRR